MKHISPDAFGDLEQIEYPQTLLSSQTFHFLTKRLKYRQMKT